MEKSFLLSHIGKVGAWSVVARCSDAHQSLLTARQEAIVLTGVFVMFTNVDCLG
jgi:hypothetical protein